LLAARDVLTLEPECYRAHDAMCRFGGVTNLHEATTTGPATFAQALPQRLQAIDALPDIVRQHLEKPAADETILFGVLTRAGRPEVDDGEPSWAVLCRLIRETRFVQVYRRLNFLRTELSMPTEPFWSESASAVADHPYRPFLESLASPPEKANRALKDQIEHLDTANVQATSYPMLLTISQSQHARSKVAWAFGFEHLDNTARELADLVRRTTGPDQIKGIQALLEISPHSHYARAMMIEKDWPHAKPHFAEWEKDANNSPVLLAALGKRYSALGKVEEARRTLSRYITFSPDYWAYQLLARSYKDRGEMGRWQAVLDEYLDKADDHGLTHAEVRVELANYFMGLRQWDKAWPYAEAAAETWAQWAMQCAARCAEGKKDWKQAELWLRRVTERYPDTSWAMWLQFCKRTGHGDAESARGFTEHYLHSIGDRPDIAAPWAIGYFYWVSGDLKQAMSYFRKAYDANPAIQNAVNLILIADELGDAAALDEWIQTFLTQYPGQAPKSTRIYQTFLEANGRGRLEPADLKEVEQILDGIGAPPRPGETDFLVGCYLKNHGKVEEGRRHLELIVKSPSASEWVKAVAGESLRRLGVDVKALHAAAGGAN
jgi:tetratricopeptide (TPR) repeat protein